MNTDLSPKYGRLRVEGLSHLVERLQLVEDFFEGRSQFSAYASDSEGRVFYGLAVSDMMDLFGEGQAQLATLSANCSDSFQRSVNLNLRFRENLIDGQYIIIAKTPFDQRNLAERLSGKWAAPSSDVLQKNEAISRLIKGLQDRPASLSPHTAREDTGPYRTTESVRTAMDPVIDSYPLLFDAFPFDSTLVPEVFIHVLEQLNLHFFSREDFFFRIVSKSGEPFNDVGLDGVYDFLLHRRSQLRRIYAEVHTSLHEWMTLQLDFGDTAAQHQIELEVSSKRNKQIQATLRHSLSMQPDSQATHTSMIHEMFTFSPATFRLDQVLKLVKGVASRFMDLESVTVFLSTKKGETYSGLTLKSVRQLFQQYESEVGFLLFTASKNPTGETFSLMFQFGGQGQLPHGSLSMMLGHHGTHQAIRALIWKELQLQTYLSEALDVGLQPLRGREMRVQPAFQCRNFEPKPLTALIIMQLEAYWSDAVWEELKQQLNKAGYSSIRAEGLFVQKARELVWSQMNECSLLIADLTYKHPGVFYYLGIAHTLGIKTIIISQLGRDIPDDFKEFPIVVYDNNLAGIAYLKKELDKLLISI